LNQTCSRHYFRKSSQHTISEKSVHWEPSCSIRTEGQTDRQTRRS